MARCVHRIPPAPTKRAAGLTAVAGLVGSHKARTAPWARRMRPECIQLQRQMAALHSATRELAGETEQPVAALRGLPPLAASIGWLHTQLAWPVIERSTLPTATTKNSVLPDQMWKPSSALPVRGPCCHVALARSCSASWKAQHRAWAAPIDTSRPPACRARPLLPRSAPSMPLPHTCIALIPLVAIASQSLGEVSSMISMLESSESPRNSSKSSWFAPMAGDQGACGASWRSKLSFMRCKGCPGLMVRVRAVAAPQAPSHATRPAQRVLMQPWAGGLVSMATTSDHAKASIAKIQLAETAKRRGSPAGPPGAPTFWCNFGS